MSSSDSDSDFNINEQNTSRKRFTAEEDEVLKALVDGKENVIWSEVSKSLPGRTPRQCRDRYRNYLFKDVVRKPWTQEEDNIIVDKYQIFGNRWAKIAQFLDGRSGNNVKNRWHKHLALHNPLVKNAVHEKTVDKENKEDINTITFPEVLTCRPWELVTPDDLIATKK